MKIISDKEEMVFRNDYEDKVFYSLGISKKDKDGNYVNGYIKASFKKGTDLKNKTKIKIKEAWLDFYKKENATIPTIFIYDYDIIDTDNQNEENSFNEKGQVQINSADLPF